MEVRLFSDPSSRRVLGGALGDVNAYGRRSRDDCRLSRLPQAVKKAGPTRKKQDPRRERGSNGPASRAASLLGFTPSSPTRAVNWSEQKPARADPNGKPAGRARKFLWLPSTRKMAY